MHRHVDTSKHICPSDTLGLRQPKTSEGGVVEQNRDKTHSGTDTHQGTSFRGTHINTHTHNTWDSDRHTSHLQGRHIHCTAGAQRHPSHTQSSTPTHAEAAASERSLGSPKKALLV